VKELVACDMEDPECFSKMVAARSYKNELIYNVVNANYLDFSLALLGQLKALNIEHYVLLANQVTAY
jgi:Fe2+ transport system protein B